MEKRTIILGINPSNGGRPLSERMEGIKIYRCFRFSTACLFFKELIPLLNDLSMMGIEIRM